MNEGLFKKRKKMNGIRKFFGNHKMLLAIILGIILLNFSVIALILAFLTLFFILGIRTVPSGLVNKNECWRFEESPRTKSQNACRTEQAMPTYMACL